MSINLYSGDSEKLQLITSAACTIDAVVFYHDKIIGKAALPTANEAFPQTIIFPGACRARAITTQTTTDLVSFNASYGDLCAREIESIHITNKHATDPVNVTPLFYSNGVAYRMGCGLLTLQAGQSLQWTEHTGWILPSTSVPLLMKVLSVAEALLNQNTVQPVFPTLGGVTVLGNTTYEMDAHLIFSTGATSHTTGLSFTGTATITNIDYRTLTFSTASLTIGPLSTAAVGSFMRVAVATNIVISQATTAVEQNILLRGILRTNAGGTFIPNLTWSADPTGACNLLRDSYFKLTQLPGDKTLAAVGVWA